MSIRPGYEPRFCFGNSTIFLALHPFIVVIESEELAKSIRPIFEIAWAKGKEIGMESK